YVLRGGCLPWRPIGELASGGAQRAGDEISYFWIKQLQSHLHVGRDTIPVSQAHGVVSDSAHNFVKASTQLFDARPRNFPPARLTPSLWDATSIDPCGSLPPKKIKILFNQLLFCGAHGVPRIATTFFCGSTMRAICAASASNARCISSR